MVFPFAGVEKAPPPQPESFWTALGEFSVDMTGICVKVLAVLWNKQMTQPVGAIALEHLLPPSLWLPALVRSFRQSSSRVDDSAQAHIRAYSVVVAIAKKT